MHRLAPSLSVLLLAGCAALPRATGERPPPWSAPPLERCISIRDGRSGAEVSLGGMLDSLARADVVFLGESHTDETTHRVELGVYEGLLARRGGRVVLALEMFERDVQTHLDAYLQGRIDEPTFLARARPWSNYATAYRPLIERARAERRVVVASNFPQPLRRRLATEGPGVLASLEGDARREAPARLLPNSDAYWRRADNAIRSHRGMLGGVGEVDRLYSTQSLWDNSMGEACALAVDAHPGHVVLHVNGGFHSEYWDGTVHQLLARRPRTRVRTVAITPVANPAVAQVGGVPVADFVVFAESRASDVDSGAWSVTVNREQEYRLHMPAGLGGGRRVPLLIWLGDDGLTAADGVELWRERLGGEAAIAVLEPLYPEVAADLSPGGRWFRADSFAEDVGAVMTAVERAWGYVLRHFPIDAERVCLAGEGTGATVVAATALLTDRMRLRAVALHPRRYLKIKDFPLPLPELFGEDPPPARTLRVVAPQRDQNWWSAELGEYGGIGLDASLEASGDAWGYEDAAQNALREALGLEARPAPAAARRRYIVADSDSPRARHWARLRALRGAATAAVAVLDGAPVEGDAEPLSTAVRAEEFAGPDALPRCQGAFGGTTVIVVSAGAPQAEVQAWAALEEADPIHKASRFHRLRVARDADGQRLPDVLARLESEGRTNVLVVPATFCADAAAMRALRRSVRAHEDTMTIQWLPGLGGRERSGGGSPG